MNEVSAKKLSTKKPKQKNSSEKIERKPGDQFELVEFVVKHFRILNWKEFSGHSYYASDVLQLLNDAILMFQEEPSLCHVSPPVTIVGDLNGQFQDLIRIFNIKNEKSKKEDEYKQTFATEKFVFLGDYTDDSQYNLETICLLFGLKMLYNQRYILLRGHQETCATSEFQKQIFKKFPGGPGEEIWEKFKTAFSLLPAAACVGEKILCVHGGIPSNIKKSVAEFRKIPKNEMFETLHATVRELLFNCPINDDGEGAEADEPIFFTSVEKEVLPKMFNEAAVREFCEKTKIELIVRSHEVVPNGFRFFADKKMITIFSAPAYHRHENKGAFLRVDEDGVVSIIQLRPTQRQDEEKPKKKKSGESGKKSEKKDSKESARKRKKGSKEVTKDSKEDGKKTTSKEIESLYDNISERGPTI